MTESRIVFQPYGKRLKAESGKNLFEAAMEIGVNLRSICGGRGSCGKCRVIIRDGEENLSPASEREKILLPEEHLTNGMRLACQAQVKKEGTIIVEIPKESQVDQQRLLLTGLEREVNLSPAVRNVTVHVKKPSFPDAGSDIDRLVEAVESESGLKPRVDYEALKKIPNVLRNGNWTVTVTIWNDTEIVSVEPGVLGDLYGFAVDVGTTKLAGYLVDLNRGKTIATASRMNPQIAYGEDVISRIHYIAKDEKNLTKLRAAVADAINQLIKEACENAGVTPERICDMTLTGNTAMHHISLGIPPNYVALTPYPAALQSPANIKARDLTFAINRGAYVHAFPNIAGFVGGDAVADVLATGIWDTDELCMLIDIGTNTEIVLGSESRLSACSCASGPAFEGAHIEHGMRATTGAIEHVWIDPETVDVTCKTIDNQRPAAYAGQA
jgi:uncharacterized 2Fe-2S/4Fe-4S cluster protein (DUF4445 family)